MLHQIMIQKNDAGQRLDKFLSKFMPTMPRNMLYKLIRQKDIRYNQKRCKGNEILHEGDILQIYAKEEFFAVRKNFPVSSSCPDLQIIQEDENFLFLCKPSGQDVHSGSEKFSSNLIGQVQAYLMQKGEYSPQNEQSFAPALCNRIDRNTTGLVIAAKNFPALQAMNEAIRLRQIQKIYLAITAFPLPEKKATCSAFLKKNPSTNRVEISLTQKNSAWQEISTSYEVLAQHGKKQLVRIRLNTGRSHQIRAHLAFLGAPILGDPKYGNHSGTETKQCLCAFSLRFPEVGNFLSYLKDTEIKTPVPEFVKTYFPEIEL